MRTADVIVIGGGIGGISAAAHLASHMSVIVLEAEARTGTQATARSAAIFIRNYGNAALRALNAVSEPVLQAPDPVFDGDVLSPRGEMLIATEAELAVLEAYADGAVGLERLSPEDALRHVPILRQDRIAGAVFEPCAQDIDVDRLLAGYTRLLRRRGGVIVTGARATGIRRDRCAWRIDTSAGEVRAGQLVNAAGAWAAAIGALAGAQPIALTPMRRSAALLPAPAGQDVVHWPLFGSITETWYAKPTAGKLMVSPAEEDPVAAHDAWADDMVIAEGLDRYAQAVTTPVTRVETTWAGLRTFAPDRTPVVGYDARAPGFFWLAGQGGYGVQTAPALAALTETLVTGAAPALDDSVLAALDPARFEDAQMEMRQ